MLGEFDKSMTFKLEGTKRTLKISTLCEKNEVQELMENAHLYLQFNKWLYLEITIDQPCLNETNQILF